MGWARWNQIKLMRRRGVAQLGEEPVGKIEQWATDILRRDAERRRRETNNQRLTGGEQKRGGRSDGEETDIG